MDLASSTPPTPTSPNVVVISGGTAANSLVSAFQSLAGPSQLTYVLPIRQPPAQNSDNGGSSSEISRVLGGPGIGDIRSRLVRLMNEGTPEHAAIKKLMSHRLSVDDGNSARSEWLEIVDGTHSLWAGISSEKRELLRSFLRYVQSDISKFSRPGSRFDFRNGSIGNLFLTGARLFFGSLESSIYLLSSISSLAENITVLPIINTNHSTHIAAKLPCSPYVIVGQNQISHPSPADGVSEERAHTWASSLVEDEDGTSPPGTLSSLNGSMRNIHFSKSNGVNALPGMIEHVFYVNPYGNEVHPSANPKVISALRNADTLIYSIGSLFTSIIPCLIPKGIAKAITESPNLKFKILLLNNSFDRETTGFTSATDYLKAIIKACQESLSRPHVHPRSPTGPSPQIPEPSPEDDADWSRYVTHMVYLRGCEIAVDTLELKGKGVECVGVWASQTDGTVYESGVLGRVLTGICSGRGGGLQRRATVQNYPIRQPYKMD